MELKAGTILQDGKYQILSVLGQGGFGITYLAEQVALERKVAIKEFFLRDFCDRSIDGASVTLGTQGSHEMVERYMIKFRKEAKLISKFNHPNVIHVHDVFDENNTVYYVMEYLEGQSLSALIEQRGVISEQEAVHYISIIGSALDYIHSFGVNHLDVKPANIMLCSNGNPVLIDFGVSKQYDSSGNQTSSTPVGMSEGYAPSEQYRKGGLSSFSPQTDIYSLGATLYKLVTGQTPPPASDVLNDGLPALPVNLSQGVRNAIVYAMQPRKIDRPSSVGAFLSLLSGHSESTKPLVNVPSLPESTPTPHPIPPIPSTTSSSDTYWPLLVVVGMVLIIIIAISVKGCGTNKNYEPSLEDSCAFDTTAVDTCSADTAYYDEDDLGYRDTYIDEAPSYSYSGSSYYDDYVSEYDTVAVD